MVTDNDARAESSTYFICANRIEVTKPKGLDKLIRRVLKRMQVLKCSNVCPAGVIRPMELLMQSMAEKIRVNIFTFAVARTEPEEDPRIVRLFWLSALAQQSGRIAVLGLWV